MATKEAMVAAARTHQRKQYRRAQTTRAEALRLRIEAETLDAEARDLGDAPADLKRRQAAAVRALSVRYDELADAHLATAREGEQLLNGYRELGGEYF